MKRKLLLALIALTCALCLVFSLAGCNPAENQSGTQQETPGGQGGEQGGNSDDNKPDTHNYIFKCSQTEHWQVCTDCGEETAHTPHSVSDGVCPACGYVEKCTEGLKFEFNEGIVGYEVSDGTATDSHIFIPSFYNNLPVISIGEYAFSGRKSLTEITIPNSVTSIGASALKGCESLAKITIPDSVTSIGASAFEDCYRLKEITIGNSVTSIGASAFEDCYRLKEITIPQGVTSIGNNAFNGCTSLTEITIPQGVTSIGRYAFYNSGYYNDEANWENEVLYIENYLIGAKYTLSGSYQIAPGTKLIADVAFMECKTLTEITIPDSVTSIGDYAFKGCTSLEEITISDSVTSIGNGVFWYCESLKEITIPDSVTSIGYGAFSDCTSLENITVDKENKVYRSEGNCLIEKETQTVIVGCKTSKIPEGITSIGSGAFAGCTSLTEITIPDSVTSIGNRAFEGCTNIKTATMPTLAIIYIPKNNLQTVILTSGDSIGDNAFYGCYGLTEITIPDSVTFIGESAFYGCRSLERVIFENTAGWKVSYHSDMSNPEEINVDNPEQNAENLKDTYSWYYWKRGE